MTAPRRRTAAPGRARGFPGRGSSARPCPCPPRSRPRRTGAARAAARRRPPRSRRPRRCGGRARRPRRAARRPRARRPRCRRRGAGTTCAPARPESPNGSNTNTSPSARRRAIVESHQVGLDRTGDRGPAQSSSAGIAIPADLPDCGGPNATSACRCSAWSSRPPRRPSTSRPARRERPKLRRGRSSGALAQRAPPARREPSADPAAPSSRTRRRRRRASPARRRTRRPRQTRPDGGRPRAGGVRQARGQPRQHAEQLSGADAGQPDPNSAPARPPQSHSVPATASTPPIAASRTPSETGHRPASSSAIDPRVGQPHPGVRVRELGLQP